MMLHPVIAATLRLSFGALFGVAGLHKIANFREFTITLSGYLSGTFLDKRHLAAGSAMVVVAFEGALTAACMVPACARVAACLSAVVLFSYAAAMYLNLRRGNELPDCGCSWGSGRHPVRMTIVFRNLFLAAFASMIALPVSTHPLAPIETFSVLAAAATVALIYSAGNTLLALTSSGRETP